MKRILGILAAAAIIGIPLFAQADVPTVSYKSTYTGTGTRTGPVISLAGQNTCTVTTSGGASGYTVTVKGSSVGSGTLTTLTQFGTSGAITTDSANAGNLTATVVALTNFTYTVTGTITGTLTVVETCSSAGSSPVAGTVSGTVAVSNFPTPFPTSSPGGAQLVVLANPSAVPMTSATAGADTASNTQTAPINFVFLHGFNGASWDRLRSNTPGDGFTPPSVGVLEGMPFNLAFNGLTWDRLRKDAGYSAGPIWSTSGGSATAAVATGSGNTIIKGGPGRLARIVITTAGTTGDATCYDNATTNSGKVIAVVPGTTDNSSAAIGDVITLDMPAANGITCANVANGPAFTVSYF